MDLHRSHLKRNYWRYGARSIELSCQSIRWWKEIIKSLFLTSRIYYLFAPNRDNFITISIVHPQQILHQADSVRESNCTGQSSGIFIFLSSTLHTKPHRKKTDKSNWSDQVVLLKLIRVSILWVPSSFEQRRDNHRYFIHLHIILEALLLKPSHLEEVYRLWKQHCHLEFFIN